VFVALQPHAAEAQAIATAEPAAIVVHVADYQGVRASERAEAFRRASDVFLAIGVALTWTDRPRHNEADGLIHIDLVILNAEMSDRHRPNPTTFGVASHVTKRAYVYYPRIAKHCGPGPSDRTRALALVIAHELGHVLLPEYSHSTSGLMQREWKEQVVTIPPFLPWQARAIRAMVAEWR
jgi:hypothetical protein